MSETFVIPAMGWLPDYPDIRDLTPESEVVAPRLRALGQLPVKAMLAQVGAEAPVAALPASVLVCKTCPRPWWQWTTAT